METFSLNRGEFLEKSHNSKLKRGNYTKKTISTISKKKTLGFLWDSMKIPRIPIGFQKDKCWDPKSILKKCMDSIRFLQKRCGEFQRGSLHQMGITMPLVPIIPSIKNVGFRENNPCINNEVLFKFRPKSHL